MTPEIKKAIEAAPEQLREYLTVLATPTPEPIREGEDPVEHADYVKRLTEARHAAAEDALACCERVKPNANGTCKVEFVEPVTVAGEEFDAVVLKKITSRIVLQHRAKIEGDMYEGIEVAKSLLPESTPADVLDLLTCQDDMSAVYLGFIVVRGNFTRRR